jgi:hypothetical protein
LIGTGESHIFAIIGERFDTTKEKEKRKEKNRTERKKQRKK